MPNMPQTSNGTRRLRSESSFQHESSTMSKQLEPAPMKTNTFSKTLAALAAFPLITINAHATPGGLDTTFGTGGKVTTPFGTGHDLGSDVAVQADGKIVVVGPSHNGTNNDFAVARYTSTGALDTTFNGTGKVTTPIGSGDDYGSAVALQEDGKIVVAGNSSNGTNMDFAVARYTSTGALDTTFNGNGKVTTPIGSDYESISAVAVQVDGKILVAGTTSNGGNYDFALARYTSPGALDTTFNGTGKVTTAIGCGYDGLNGLVVQADGRIVVAGNSFNGTTDDFAIARYTSTGALDTTFNGTGKVTTDFGGSNDYGQSVAMQADGKFVVAGHSGPIGNPDFAVARYTSTGALDTTFNGTGKVTTPIGGGVDQGRGVAVQEDGKIVVAGWFHGSSNYYAFALARYLTTGALDKTFNGTGKVAVPIVNTHSYATSVALQPDGKIVMAGYSENGAGFDFALARYSVALPDTRLGTTTAAPVGNNRYNLTGTGQKLKTAIPHGGGVKTDFLSIQNDGPVPDKFMVRGTPSDKNFKVTYFRGATNITASVVAGTYTTGRLATGASALLKAEIKARTAVVDKRRTLGIIATSVGDSTAKDKALIEARSK